MTSETLVQPLYQSTLEAAEYQEALYQMALRAARTSLSGEAYGAGQKQSLYGAGLVWRYVS